MRVNPHVEIVNERAQRFMHKSVMMSSSDWT